MPWVKIGSVYQLKITLRDFRPPIWRRVLVAGYYTPAGNDFPLPRNSE